MLVEHIIQEKVLRTVINNYGQDAELFVHENPTNSTLISLLKNSEWKNMRGLIDGSNLYWWDSAKAIHSSVASALNLSSVNNENDTRRLILYSEPNGGVYLGINNKHLAHPRIERLCQNPSVIVGEIGEHNFH